MQFIKTVFSSLTSFINQGTPVATDMAVNSLLTGKYVMGGASEVAQTFNLDAKIDNIASRKELMKKSGITAPEPLEEGVEETAQQREDREDYESIMELVRRPKL